MGKLFDESIPDTIKARRWRSVLLLRYLTNIVDDKNPSYYSWEDLAKIFGAESGKKLRYETLRELERHRKGQESFDLFTQKDL